MTAFTATLRGFPRAASCRVLRAQIRVVAVRCQGGHVE